MFLGSLGVGQGKCLMMEEIGVRRYKFVVRVVVEEQLQRMDLVPLEVRYLDLLGRELIEVLRSCLKRRDSEKKENSIRI